MTAVPPNTSLATEDDGTESVTGIRWMQRACNAAACLVLLLASSLTANAQSVRIDERGTFGIEPVAASGGAVQPVPTALAPDAPMGRYARLFDEAPDKPLTLQQARAHLAAGDFTRSLHEVPNLGNHAPPRWLALDIVNAGARPLVARVYLAEGWTDRVDAWMLLADGSSSHWRVGESVGPARYLRTGLGYAVDVSLPVGAHQLLMRAASVDSAALSVRVVPMAQTARLEGDAQQWLGLVHGFLLALVVTFGLFWLALRERSLRYYVLYVSSYLCMHLAYSGVGSQHVWPQSPEVACFAILIGMTVFASAGITFARDFLELSQWAPRLDRVIKWFVRAALAAMAVCVATGALAGAVSFSFAYITTFTLLMVALGIAARLRQRDQAGMFLVASLASMVGAFTTTMAVVGLLPFNDATFRAVEVGIMIEASLWALALGMRLRRHREARADALHLAERDPLTGLFNRRAFIARARPACEAAGTRPVAVLMLDLDQFKAINDRHGHEAGDRMLESVADRLRALTRSDDVAARWGGEEFVVLLVDTPKPTAMAMAERVRASLSEMKVALADGTTIGLTTSIGTATADRCERLEDLLRQADAMLYAAKQSGRNRVCSEELVAG